MAVKKSELYSMLWEACNKLRGGVEPARYKDYVLVLLFHKYVSDRYKGETYAMYNITDETSFDALVKVKGKSDIGERVDKIIQKFMEDNHLQGALPEVSFNNTDELGVDVGGSEGYIRLSVLISEHTGLPLQGVPRIGHGRSEVDGIRFIEFPLGIVASC